jgi:Fe-S-cluster containining protein
MGESTNKENVEFSCLRCGKCCHEVILDEDGTKGYKRIPLFLEEADRLENLAKDRGVPLKIIEDLVFPDVKNKKILVLTYRIMLENDAQCCPFYAEACGCTINEVKPLACRAFPLALKTEDAFNMRINIDPTCGFTEKYRDQLENITADELKKKYPIEYLLAKDLLIRSKRSIMNLMEKQATGAVEIPLQINGKDFDQYLKEWDREMLE